MKRTALAAALLIASLGAAQAEDGGLGGFFSHLFGGPPQPTPAPAPKADVAPSPRATVARKRRKPAAPANREASAPSAPSTPPATATKFVYVLGDSLAISAADGMAQDLASKPDLGVIDRARDASGLVREDYFDWDKAARELAGLREAPPKEKDGKPSTAAEKAKDKVDYVVIMLGINDKQPVRDGKEYVDPLTDRWKAVYAQRIQAMVAPLKAAHIPVLWVGLPPMRADKFNPQTIVDLNQLFKENAEAAGAKFLDVFDDFADQNGQFDAFGPNLEGQKVKLRGSDGIHFAAAGSVKLAHFIDVEVLAALGEAAPAGDDIAALPPDVNKATDDINEQIRREMGQPTGSAAAPAVEQARLTPAEAPKPPPKPEAGPIVSLGLRPLSPGAALASTADPAPSEAERSLRAGDPPRAEPGRADDFSR